MEVAILTTAQARSLYKRFGFDMVIQPMPLKGDRWYITRRVGLAIKEKLIDKVDVNPRFKEKAQVMWDVLKDHPRDELDEYPQFKYNTSIDPNNATPEELAELEEYTARFQELNFENVI